jgi:hypothetical protein
VEGGMKAHEHGVVGGVVHAKNAAGTNRSLAKVRHRQGSAQPAEPIIAGLAGALRGLGSFATITFGPGHINAI